VLLYSFQQMQDVEEVQACGLGRGKDKRSSDNSDKVSIEMSVYRILYLRETSGLRVVVY
jgi:hypothetical protein